MGFVQAEQGAEKLARPRMAHEQNKTLAAMHVSGSMTS
jgi:hypothetical protein